MTEWYDPPKPEWYDSVNHTTGRTFQSPGEVDLRAGEDTIIIASRVSLSLGCDADKKLTLVTLRAEFDRSMLLRLCQVDKRIKLTRDEFIQLPVEVPVTVMYVGQPTLIDRLSGLVASGLEPAAKEQGLDGFPLCLDVNNYDVESMSTPSSGSADRARPEVICFYRMESDDTILTEEHERLPLGGLTAEARGAFLSDGAPILTMLEKQDILQEINAARERGRFTPGDEQHVENLKNWVSRSHLPFIGFQLERVAEGAPNRPGDEVLRDDPGVLAFYRLATPEANPVEHQEAYLLEDLVGGFNPDVEPYLTVKRRLDLLSDLPRGAGDSEKEGMRLLKVWLEAGSEDWVGYQYEVPGPTTGVKPADSRQ